ncbi:hypothetical protein D5086_018944, partial [Populus alba]
MEGKLEGRSNGIRTHETDTDESAFDSSDLSQLKPSDLGDVNPITPPLSTNNHVRTSPLELPMCITSKQMALPSSETSSSSQVPPTDLPKMTPSRAHPPESIAQSVGCDDTGFTLVTRRKKKKDIPEMKTRPSADKQVNSDAFPSHQVKDNASPTTNTDDKQLNGDAYTSHQGKGNAITSLATNTDEMSSEESDSSGETDTDSSDETDTDESASDSSDESQLKPSDLGDVNPITPPLSANNHVRTSPLELPMCITSKQMTLPSSSETSSSSQVPPTDLPKMTPSRAHPPESISIEQSIGCDDTGFTLVTRRKKKKDIPKMKTRPSADKQTEVNSDASPSHQVKGNASHASNTDDKQLNGDDASTSHQG